MYATSASDSTLSSAALYLSTETESYELFADEVLYRRTTGFKGDITFNVSVDSADLPNVVVVVIESFRHRDSLYLVGNTSAEAREQHNITLTPNFDKWAQRGIALRNLWSSWQTSRSLESILFGQVPFDNGQKTGVTGGRTDVKLHGLPQLFNAKGYETLFTAGSKLAYDAWDTFLQFHGFDHVWETEN
ncbi:hypothetical protein Poli38472_009508 [Pythium oligandrum]|uniref:Sulfatase N-terminal domain-containing protein n=1 Tax=Pythium oligandrum TaxID=41045 RepID=A0A8K1CFW0_PYTOL|nr:hypothetical protein Poli38472_009508 [Pythium oligandrum]|eukprot:TMW62015.1 hypothetical protein Poli38472_009508 [Pythium oligandrum]